MAIKGAGTQAAPDDTTLVVYRGSRVAVDPERKRDLAKRCGVKFILLYNKPDRLHPEGSVSGFQKVELQVLPAKGGHGTEPFARWHKNEITQEPAAEGAMDFIADEFGQGRAYLPDSAFNRVRLAYAEIFQNSLWLIEDAAIAEEIRALASEIKKSIEFREEQEAASYAAMEVETSVLERNAATGREVKSRIEIQNEVLRKKIAELEAKEIQRELKEKAARLQARLGGVSVETEAQPLAASPAEPDDPMKALRDQARADVYAANPELVESVKGAQIAAKGKASGWGFTPRFKQEIQPLIDKRFDELVKEAAKVAGEQDEHSAVGDVT